RLRLILPKSGPNRKLSAHTLWLGSLVALHFLMLGAWSFRFRPSPPLLSAVIVFFAVSFMDRLNGRIPRSLALDFAHLGRLRLRPMFQGLLMRAVLISVIPMILSILLLSGFSRSLLPFTASLVLLGLQGLLNQIWIYSSSGIESRGSHPVRWSVAAQLLTLGMLLIAGSNAVVVLFYLGSILSIVLSIQGLTWREQSKSRESGILVKFDWDPVLPNRVAFRNFVTERKLECIHLDRKTRVVHFADTQEWLRTLESFPLNIRNWKKIRTLPARPPIKPPVDAKFYRLDVWGFWRPLVQSTPLTPEESRHLHLTQRNFRELHLYSSQKQSWKHEIHGGITIWAGPRDHSGVTLWLR
ncbi:MAG: hypothetical protein KGP28_07135, partial [Bdellovibrionales bacterium]|nr:hypothetical protein [Bdellovibrionales bacterium]